jgi:hypothetical protein
MKTINRRRVLARALAGPSLTYHLWETARRVYGGAEKLTSALIKEKIYGIAAKRPGLRRVLSDFQFERLTRRHADTAAANLIRLQHYDEFSDRLTRRDVRFMPIKGCDLVGTLYGDPGERAMTDIDILVHPDDFDEAVAVAVGFGYKDIEYRFRLPGIWASTTMYKDTGDSAFHLDIHHCPGPELGRRRVETRRFFYHREPGTRPTDEQRLLFSVIHHQNHFFDSSLADLYESLLLARRSDMNTFIRVANRWDVGAAASVVFGQIANFFGFVEPIDGWRRSTIGAVTNRLTNRRAGRRPWTSALIFALSTDRPTEAIKFGVESLLKKHRKKAAFFRKKP